MEIISLTLLFIFIFGFLVFYTSFSWGYVATVIANWFIIPLFPEFPQFTWLQYAGIMFFISCFVHGSLKEIKKEYKDENMTWINIISAPWLTLLGAWILHLIY